MSKQQEWLDWSKTSVLQPRFGVRAHQEPPEGHSAEVAQANYLITPGPGASFGLVS